MTTSLPLSEAQVLALPRARVARGTVQLPGSKSISNRVLLLAALADGATDITGLLDADDVRVMRAALIQLGATLAEHDGIVRVSNERAGGLPFSQRHADLFLGNAGTALRPLTAALALIGGDYRLSGVPRMHERPIGDLVDALRTLGAQIDYLGQPGYPPLSIGAVMANHADTVSVRGNVSSQFLTALLLAAPLAVQARGRALTIAVEGELISRPYIDITLNLMARFGVTVEVQDGQRFVVPETSRYQSPGRIAVEGDASSASYFLALGAIGGGPVRVTGVGARSIQGDVAFADTLAALGATLTKGENWIEAAGVQVAAGERLRAFDLGFNLIPDAAMTAAVLALYADGPCTLRNIGSWRVKETDRIHAMQVELTKLGARVDAGPDWLRVTPPEAGDWRGADIGTWDDHRMAMCFSLAAFAPTALVNPVRILHPECVSKTFPDYFDVYRRLLCG